MEESKYPRAYDYLNEGLDDQRVYLTDDELDTLFDKLKRDKASREHVGVRFERTKTNPIEEAFYLQWVKENNPVYGVNNGHGMLQDLLIQNDNPMMPFSAGGKVLEFIDARDRKIVATVIQWLGSNCGMSFLSESLRIVGARIIFDKDKAQDGGR